MPKHKIASSRYKSHIFKPNYIHIGIIFICLLITLIIALYQKTNLLTQISDTQAAAPVLAFPGAEGFGAETIGGRGGKVMEVTNLNDSGTGSLRACAEATGPRTCVFRVGGTIETQSAITIKNPYITIAGQTAPGGGITLKAAPGYDKGSLTIRTSHVIIRYLRFRPGPSTVASSMRRGISIESASATNTTHHIIIDHCSISWATDDNLTLIDGVRDTTIQWSIIAEALSQSTHSDGEHSKGLAISGKMYNSTVQTGNISVHHNLLAHNRDRNPRHAAWGTVDIVNNVIYNWGHVGFEANDAQTKAPANLVGNYFKRGTNTSTSQYEIHVDAENGHGASLYVLNNLGPNRSNDTAPQENIVRPVDRPYLTSVRFAAPAITTTTAQQAYELVLAQSGAHIPMQDSVDQRVISEVKSGTGRIINNPSDVGGWPAIVSGTAPTDTDHDGMPDQWETARNLNPNSDDSAADRNNDGYTNLEEYLNGLVAGDVTTPPIPTSSPTPSRSPTPSPTRTPTAVPTPSRSPIVTTVPTSSPTSSPSPTLTPVQQTITLTPVEDALIRRDNPNSNYGTSSRLEVDGWPVKMFFLKFNLEHTTIKPANIASATVRMRVTNSSGSQQNVFLVNNNWNEHTVTYNNRPTFTKYITSFRGGREGNWIQFNITDTVRTLQENTFTLGLAQNGYNGLDVYSKDNATNKPQLVITTN